MYPHLYQKLKKAQMEEERCSEIERDNHTLVKRMTEIMKRSAIETKNPVQYRSLNKDRRRQELIKITQENQALLKRIQSKQPTYNHLMWEQDREKSEALCARICRYPYRPGPEYSADYYEDEYYQPSPQGNGYQPAQQTAQHAEDHTAESEGYAAPESEADHQSASQSQNMGMSQSQKSAKSGKSDRSGTSASASEANQSALDASQSRSSKSGKSGSDSEEDD